MSFEVVGRIHLFTQLSQVVKCQIPELKVAKWSLVARSKFGISLNSPILDVA